MRKSTLNDVRFIGSLTVAPSGAIVQRQLVERSIAVSDELFAKLIRWLFEALSIASYLVNLNDRINGVIDKVLLSIRDDLTLIVSSLVVDYVPIPKTLPVG